MAELRIRSRRPLNIYSGALDAADLDVLVEAFEALAADLAMGDAVCLVQIPFWAPLAERLRERLGWRVVYDCMDEWTNFPGFGARGPLARGGARPRRRRHDRLGRPALGEVEGGGAPARSSPRTASTPSTTGALYGPNDAPRPTCAHPVIGYYGALASWVDVPLLEKIADAHPEATIVLAGGHFDVDLSPIAKRPNVRLLGQRPYDEMPKLLWNFDVCMIPFLVNDITEATNPVKFYEYLYGGKPVVAPALTELLPVRGAVVPRARRPRGVPGDSSTRRSPSPPTTRAAPRAAGWPRRTTGRTATRRSTRASTEAHPLVSVVVVTYGGLELTKACLESLLSGETWPRLEVLVVDNASTRRDAGVPASARRSRIRACAAS